jgi:hypothetical protein
LGVGVPRGLGGRGWGGGRSVSADPHDGYRSRVELALRHG